MSDQIHPRVIDVAFMRDDEHARREAAIFMGSLTMRDSTELVPVKPPETLLDKLWQAEQGDKQALLAVGSNIHTELVEWTRKTKNIVQVRSQILPDAQLVQHGHLWRDIHANTLINRTDSAVLQRRAPIETINSFRIEESLKKGTLKDYLHIVCSSVPDDLTAEKADKEGFFGESMSLAIQATSQDKYGVLTESAFAAGADGRDSPRFDVATLVKIYEYLGIDISDATSEEILARPLLIHKSLMPHGVSDFVKLYDHFAGGDRFFGVVGATGSYDSFADNCFEREREFDELAGRITSRLIDERATFSNPMQLVRRISWLAKHYLVERSLEDTSIDPVIFGYEAAWHIANVRQFLDSGQTEKAAEATHEAHKTAKGSSCLSFSGADGSNDPEDWSGGSTEKFAKCQSCKSFVLEVGGCKICESCTKQPWIMEHAWRKFQQEQKQQKADAKKKERAPESPEKRVTINAGATAVASQFAIAA